RGYWFLVTRKLHVAHCRSPSHRQSSLCISRGAGHHRIDRSRMLCSSERRRRFSALLTAGLAVAMAWGSSFGKIPILDVGPGPACACTSPHEAMPFAQILGARQKEGRRRRLLLAAHAPEQNAEAEARQAQGPDDDMPQ